MEEVARALIVRDGKILFIHRIRGGRHYYVLPGGHREKNETFEETVTREVKEETNLDVELGLLFWKMERLFEEKHELNHFFFVKSFRGELKFGGEELDEVSETNKFFLEWVSPEEMKEKVVYPPGLTEKIIEFLSKNNSI